MAMQRKETDVMKVEWEALDSLSEDDMASFDLPTSFGNSSASNATTLKPIAIKRTPDHLSHETSRSNTYAYEKRLPHTDQLISNGATIATPGTAQETVETKCGTEALEEADSNPEVMGCSAPSRDITIPCAYEVSIPAHSKLLSAFAVNPKASRMITAGLDYQMRLWDFNGMTTALNSFRQLIPNEGHAVQAVDYSCNGSHFVCAAGDSICRLYDMDAKPLQQTVKGDMYIRDMSNTKGHTHMVTDCQFHPFDRYLFISSAVDGTVRLWDMNSTPYGVDQALPHTQCLKVLDKRNMNSSASHALCCSWSSAKADTVIGGCIDASVQLWNLKRAYGKPDHVVRNAHTDEVSDILFFEDGQRILSRSVDESMKLWDIRKLKLPVHTWDGLQTKSNRTNVTLSQDESFIVTATQDPKGKGGSVVFFDSKNQALVKILRFESTAPIQVLWPAEINQLLISCNDGSVKILYDTDISQKGALLFISKHSGKAKDLDMGNVNPLIVTPADLPPGYKETRSGMIRKVKPRGREKERIEREVNKSIIPPRPTGKEGTGGQIATRTNLSQHILSQLSSSNAANEDPVEKLRSIDTSESFLFKAAYGKTQPTTILDYSMDHNETEELLLSTDKCPRCGLKMCQCGYLNAQKAVFGPNRKQQRTS